MKGVCIRRAGVGLALLALLVGLCVGGCTAGGERAEKAEVVVINVGKGDAILVKARERAYLIDTAKAERWGMVQSMLKQEGVTNLNGVFLTHTDRDHAGGLIPLAQSGIEVAAWYASGYCLDYEHEDDHPAVQAAAVRGREVKWLYAGDCVDGMFDVLAPSVAATDKDDNNSLVMMLSAGGGKVLLAGDMEFPEETVLLSSGSSLECDILKVANHADDDTLSEAFARAAHPKLALISTDPYEKTGTPDAGLISRLEAVGAQVYRTDFTEAGLRATLEAGSAKVESVSWKDRPAPCETVSISAFDVPGDRLTLSNSGAEAVELGGWYLYSSRGKEFFAFPSGARLSAGASATIGGRSAEAVDYLWDEKRVIHKSKEDVLTLYDSWGRAVSSVTANG